jgi:hypothetical protein
MNKVLMKWILLCVFGAGALAFTAVCFIRKDYTWVMVGLFIGLFLVSSSWKRIRFLQKAGRAQAAGQKEIIVFYRDKNLNESQEAVIPAGADAFWFYGFLAEKKYIKAFRWQGIRKVLENGTELTKDELLKKLEEPSPEK